MVDAMVEKPPSVRNVLAQKRYSTPIAARFDQKEVRYCTPIVARFGQKEVHTLSQHASDKKRYSIVPLWW